MPFSISDLVRRFWSGFAGSPSRTPGGTRQGGSSPSPYTVELRVLGTVHVRSGADSAETSETLISQPKRLALLTFLALSGSREWARRDELLGLFWPEMDESRARHALSQSLYVLRNELGPDVLRTEGRENVGIDPSALWCDAEGFEREVDAGDLENALALYKGSLLPHFYVEGCGSFDQWMERERARLEGLAASAAGELAETAKARGDLREAIRWQERHLELAPYDEAALLTLLDLSERIGDRSSALLRFQEFAERLRCDLELEPSATVLERLDRLRSNVHPERHDAGRDRPTLETVGRRTLRAPRLTPGSQRGRPAALALLTLLALGAVSWLAVTQVLVARQDPPGEEIGAEPPTVAILPFENLSPDPEDAYFADGIRLEIATQLNKIEGLTVISDASVMDNQDGTEGLGSIGEELGATHVLRGAVWRADDRLRITTRLAEARSNEQVWADSQGREVAAVFAIQAEVAHRVAASLGVVLSREERRRIAEQPTDNLQAYEHYLRAQAYAGQRWTDVATFLPRAVEMYERAVALDPEFALAHAKLAQAHAAIYWYHLDTSERRMRRAREAAGRALELAPDLPDSHLALAHYHYRLRNYEEALRHYEAAWRLGLEGGGAALLRRVGRWQEAAARYERAVARDPRNRGPLEELAFTLVCLRRYDEAERYFDRLLALEPDWALPHTGKARIMAARGDIDRAKEILDEAERFVDPADVGLVTHQVRFDLFSGDYDRALERHRARYAPSDTLRHYFYRRPRALELADIFHFAGRPDSARTYYEMALPVVEGFVEEDPDWHGPDLARVYAGLGRREDALREGERILELMPYSRDALVHPTIRYDIAGSYAMVGELDRALEHLEFVLSVPGQRNSPHWIRLQPEFEPLRDDPRFQALMEEYESHRF